MEGLAGLRILSSATLVSILGNLLARTACVAAYLCC